MYAKQATSQLMAMKVLMKMVSPIVRRLSTMNVTSTLKREIQMELADVRIIAQKPVTEVKVQSNLMVSASAKTSKQSKRYAQSSVSTIFQMYTLHQTELSRLEQKMANSRQTLTLKTTSSEQPTVQKRMLLNVRSLLSV